jgi:hypothetical protein
MSEDDVAGVGDCEGAAAGWGALKAVADAVRGQKAIVKKIRGLLSMNQPHGFDCPGCAWPDPKHTSSFKFCENGAKAVAWEATAKRTTLEVFASHTVSELWNWPDFDLENEGRLTHPMVYDQATDRYLPISWDLALAKIGAALRGLPRPDMAEFCTSGRALNEAAFLYQLLAREYGTNNFPDCSNMCHEATSVGLRSADYRIQPAAQARTGAVHVTAAPYRDVDAGCDIDRVHLLSGKGRRRYRGAEGNHEDAHGTRCKKPGRRRLRRSRP